MSEKKIKKKLVDFIEKCVEKYIEEHLADLKRKLLNMDGFKSDEEYKNLQVQFEEVNDKNKDLQAYIENLQEKNNGLQQKQEFLQKDFVVVRREQDELKQEFNRLTEEKEVVEKKLAECEKNFNKAEQIIEDVYRKYNVFRDKASQEIYAMKQEIDEAHKQKATLDYFTAGYGKIDSMYKMYQKLNEDIRGELLGIFGSADTPLMFFCGALQENHLDNFWDYICNKINSGKIDRDTEGMLNSLFDFCFDMVNISQQKPMYKRLEVQTGFDFDSSYMIKTSDSSQLGNIKEVKLAGYVYASSNKVVKRSLVQIKSEDY